MQRSATYLPKFVDRTPQDSNGRLWYINIGVFFLVVLVVLDVSHVLSESLCKETIRKYHITGMLFNQINQPFSSGNACIMLGI